MWISLKYFTDEVGKKDKPLCILWAAQELREKNQITVGEYAIIPKNLFYIVFNISIMKRTALKIGYIGTNFWSQSRTEDIRDRYVHLDDHELNN